MGEMTPKPEKNSQVKKHVGMKSSDIMIFYDVFLYKI